MFLNKPQKPWWMSLASWGLACCTLGSVSLVQAEEIVTRLMGVSANPVDNQVVIKLSGANIGTLSSPLEKGKRRLLVDIAGACLASDLDKAALLDAIRTQLPDVAGVSLDEFRGATPLVRLAITTQSPDITGALLTGEGDTLVLQLVKPLAATGLKLSEPPGEKSTKTEKKADRKKPETNKAKSGPSEQVAASEEGHSATEGQGQLTASNATAPITEPRPVEHVPEAVDALPALTGVNPEDPPVTPAPVWTPPLQQATTLVPGEKSTSKSEELPPQVSTNAEEEAPPSGGATLKGKTTRAVTESRIERKVNEAASLRHERDILQSQVENLKILVDKQHALIGQLKDNQAALLAQQEGTASDKEYKKQIASLQRQVKELEGSYNQMKRTLEGYQEEVANLENQVKTAEARAQGLQQKQQESGRIEFPKSGDSRGALLNTLSTLTQAEVNNLVDAEKQFRLGKKAQLEGDLATAEAKYKNALQLAPQVAEYAVALGVVYNRQKAHDKARTVLQTALQSNPDNTELLNELGKTCLFLKDEQSALNYFEKALPTGVLNNYASTLRRANRLADAEAVYKLAIAINPADSDLLFNLGNLYLQQKRYPEAQGQFNEAIVRKHDFAEAHFHLGLAYAEQGTFDKAVVSFKRYLELMPDAPNKQAVKDYIKDLQKVSEPPAGLMRPMTTSN